MKKIITTVMALTLALGMSVTALGAGSPSKSVTVTRAYLEGESATEEEAEQVAKILASNPIELKTVDASVVAEAKTAAEKLITVKADEQLNVKEVFDVVVPDEVKAIMENGGYLYVDFRVSGITDGSNVRVLHQNADGSWEDVTDDYWGVRDGGVVTGVFKTFSNVAIVEITAKNTTVTTPTPPTPPIPAGILSEEDWIIKIFK